MQKNLTQLVLRFAPSPTGHLHVGGARTAIFNWLLARKTGGKFLLRIEDTDRERSTQESIQQILSSLQWLGLEWDGEPIYQSTRLERHRDLAGQLLASGAAFRCFCTKEELDRKRKIASNNKMDFHYDGTCSDLDTSQVESNLAAGMPFVVRLHRPKKSIEFEDAVFRTISLSSEEIDDFVIQRSDGSPVYQLAVVADDHDMGVNFVIRGADHITNTPKQIALYQALGWDAPQFCHLPLILGPDKRRLSKRHGDTSIEEFRQRGFLPQTMVNYLSLLGWSPGNDKELFETEELINAFDIQRVNKANAIFDEKKLLWMNGKYLSTEPDINIAKEAAEHFGLNWQQLPVQQQQACQQLAGILKIRYSLKPDLINAFRFFFELPQPYEEKGVKKFFLNEQATGLLSGVKKLLQHTEPFTAEILEKQLRGLADELNISAGKLIHPLRLAITGSTASPGMFEVLEIVGQTEAVARIEKALLFINRHIETDHQ